jgi:hypothetical protein
MASADDMGGVPSNFVTGRLLLGMENSDNGVILVELLLGDGVSATVTAVGESALPCIVLAAVPLPTGETKGVDSIWIFFVPMLKRIIFILQFWN